MNHESLISWYNTPFCLDCASSRTPCLRMSHSVSMFSGVQASSINQLLICPHGVAKMHASFGMLPFNGLVLAGLFLSRTCRYPMSTTTSVFCLCQ
jgi:hypothetical protein